MTWLLLLMQEVWALPPEPVTPTVTYFIDWNMFLSAIAGAFIGGILTGSFTIWATTTSLKHQRQAEISRDISEVKAFLQSIYDELDSVFNRYMSTVGKELESLASGNALMLIFRIDNDYFTVYHNNAHSLGRVKNREIRRSIVKAYTSAKGMVDSVRQNNYQLSNYQHALNLYKQTGNIVHQQDVTEHEEVLVNYAGSLKESHELLRSDFQQLFSLLNEKGIG